MAHARSFGIAFVTLAVLFVSVPAHVGSAQTREKEAVGFVLTAQIESIDERAKSLTLKGANGEGGVYVVNDKTTIMSGEKKIALGDLKKGWRVAVNGDSVGGKNVATYMEVVETDAK